MKVTEVISVLRLYELDVLLLGLLERLLTALLKKLNAFKEAIGGELERLKTRK